MKFAAVIVVLSILGLAYVRLAPSDPARWHVDPTLAVDPGNRGVLRRDPVAIADFDRIARAWPRVEVLAGSVAEGHITYVVRSRVFGFPDYISAKQEGEDLAILSRLRFGGSDLGVNRSRLDQWLYGL